ncbi:MAG: hypothetical protein ACP5VN_04295 [Acidobacteriota bacterium]
MTDGILRLIRALLSSLYFLFEGMPALEAVRSWFGGERGPSGGPSLVLFVLGGAVLLGLAGFLVFLRFLRSRGREAQEDTPTGEARR